LNPPIAITGLGALSALGQDLEAHREAFANGTSALRPLAELHPGADPSLRGAWIEPRSLLTHRKWSPLSMAGLRVAEQALTMAGWDPAERAGAAVFFGTSRGALCGWLEPWPGRRPFDLLAATNSLPAEPAAAISCEYGIDGPWQVSSTGCCAGLDALAQAECWIRSGRLQRALVVAADLPLQRSLLDAYARTGLLRHDDQPGMAPAEAAAALCLEAGEASGHTRLLGCDASANSSALLSGQGTDRPLEAMLDRACDTFGPPDLVIPHDSGTFNNRKRENRLMERFSEVPSISYKPWTGHAVAASGLLELCLAAADIGPGITAVSSRSSILKFASALGGRHSLTYLKR
jgi:3-oxoacyl-(acyl-carrier-protein) synthase